MAVDREPGRKFSLPLATATPRKPPNWKKPDRRYGGHIPEMFEGPHGPMPDLIAINFAILDQVQRRKELIATPGYKMKVRDTLHLPCNEYLHTNRDEEKQQKIIIKKVIRKRRPKAPERAPEQNTQQQQQQAVAAAAARRQQQMQQEEALRRRQQEAERQRQEAEEAERNRQAELQRQKQLEDQKRQQQEAEAERQRQAAAAEAERQRQAAAAAAAAPAPAAPVQRVATFQNLGTDPAMAKAELYYESTRWGPLGHGDPPVTVGTFPGHRWFIVANGMYAKLFTVGEDAKQTFTF